MEEKRREPEWMKMEIESRSENEEFARVAVAVFLSRLDPTVEEMDDIKTAVSEAVTNAVIHGYQGGEGTIYIETGIAGQEATVIVRDLGVGIPDIEKAMEPMYTTDLSGERSGMGFSFMEAFMDEVKVESEPGKGTTVTLKKTVGR
ncbi:MAG: anti-sigma F factor [Lacrimispora saccharolytica]